MFWVIKFVTFTFPYLIYFGNEYDNSKIYYFICDMSQTKVHYVRALMYNLLDCHSCWIFILRIIKIYVWTLYFMFSFNSKIFYNRCNLSKHLQWSLFSYILVFACHLWLPVVVSTYKPSSSTDLCNFFCKLSLLDIHSQLHLVSTYIPVGTSKHNRTSQNFTIPSHNQSKSGARPLVLYS